MGRRKNDGRGQNGGGRRKGTMNKDVKTLRQWLADFLDGQREQLVNDWMSLEPGERLRLFEKLLQYTLPKMAAVESNVRIDKLNDEQVEQLVQSLNINDVTEEDEE